MQISIMRTGAPKASRKTLPRPASQRTLPSRKTVRNSRSCSLSPARASSTEWRTASRSPGWTKPSQSSYRRRKVLGATPYNAGALCGNGRDKKPPRDATRHTKTNRGPNHEGKNSEGQHIVLDGDTQNPAENRKAGCGHGEQ